MKGPAFGNVSFSVENRRVFTESFLKNINIYWIENLEFKNNIAVRFV